MGTRLLSQLVAGVLAVLTAVPLSYAGASLGTARGFRAVEVSLDGAKSWLPLGQRPLPLLERVQVRSTTGAAVLLLGDGSRITLLPTSSLEVQESGRITEVHLRSGRVTFNLPRETRVEIRTASARLEPVRTGETAGEVFVGESKTVGLRMTQGTFHVHELAGERRTLLASLEPVFVPKRPAGAAVFAATAPTSTAVPAGARGVYTPKGESLGYLSLESQLFMHPGFTRDLTRPFPPKLVQTAMAKIPDTDRQDGTPLFDVNGGYVGYLSNSGFYGSSRVAQAQGQVAQAQIAPMPQLAQAGVIGGTTQGAETSWTPWVVAGIGVLAVGGVGGLAASGQFSGSSSSDASGTTATAIQPQ